MSIAKKQKINWPLWIIIIVAIIAIILYYSSLGTIDITKEKDKPKEKRLSKAEIAEKHKKLLKYLIEERKRIYKIRQRVYKIVYFGVRLVFIGLWATGNLILYLKLGITELGKFLDYNTAFLIGLFAVIFLFFGKLSSLSEWKTNFERRLEIWIFQKYVRQPELIENNESELIKLEENTD